nr:unnamed protein product [Trichobilharzia regenti]
MVVIFVRKIQSYYLATRMVLETVVLLWSVIFAIVFPSIKWSDALISLGTTITITISVVILSWKLSPLNWKGFIVFTSISIGIAVLAIVAAICYYFFHSRNDLKRKISCFAMVVLIELSIIIIMFTCVSIHKWLMWWFAPQPTEFILAVVIWFLMLGLFTETYTGITSCLQKDNNNKQKSVVGRYPY